MSRLIFTSVSMVANFLKESTTLRHYQIYCGEIIRTNLFETFQPCLNLFEIYFRGVLETSWSIFYFRVDASCLLIFRWWNDWMDPLDSMPTKYYIFTFDNAGVTAYYSNFMNFWSENRFKIWTAVRKHNIPHPLHYKTKVIYACSIQVISK